MELSHQMNRLISAPFGSVCSKRELRFNRFFFLLLFWAFFFAVLRFTGWKGQVAADLGVDVPHWQQAVVDLIPRLILCFDYTGEVLVTALPFITIIFLHRDTRTWGVHRILEVRAISKTYGTQLKAAAVGVEVVFPRPAPPRVATPGTDEAGLGIIGVTKVTFAIVTAASLINNFKSAIIVLFLHLAGSCPLHTFTTTLPSAASTTTTPVSLRYHGKDCQDYQS